MKKLGFLYFLVALLYCDLATAQASVDILGENLSYRTINNRLNEISTALKNKKISSADTKQDIAYINEMRPLLETRRKEVENQIGFIEKRVEALGEKGDENELRVIAQKRQEFTSELTTEKARVSEIDVLLAKMDELEISIYSLRNEELWGNLLKPSTPLFYPSVLIKSNTQFMEFVFDLVKSPYLWYTELTSEQKLIVKNRLIPVILLIIIISMLGYMLRRFIFKNFGYRDEIEQPRYGSKVRAAIAVLVAYGIIPTLLIGVCLLWIKNGQILTTGFLGTAIINFLYYSLYVIIARAISRVIFTPYHGNWRLINMSDEKSRRVTGALYKSIYLIGITSYLQHIISVSNYPLELMNYIVGISSIVKAFCVVWVSARLLWTKDGQEENVTPSEENDVEDKGDSFAFRITFLLLLLAVGIAILSVSGYAYLSSFIINNVILSVLILFTFWILRKVLYEFIHRFLLLGLWVKTFRMRRRVVRKLDFWLSFIIEPLFIIGAVFSVLVLWGVPGDLLLSMLHKLFTGFTVGGIKISILSIIIGFAVFFAAVAVVRILRDRIENRLLARMDMDEGTRHSLAAGFSSLGYVASALLAIAIMGGNLTNFALVAGALSVGIGLGLQNVVNNFVSGIILLFERPIKVGDWVVINGEEGTIKQINIRSTEIETFNRASLIIPNANLLSNSLTNLTHGNNWTRFNIKVTVAYGSDTERVKQILLDVAAVHKQVLKKPAPYVLFQNFGSNGMEFELRGYSSNIWDGWIIPSDLRFDIYRRFSEECIQIPLNQMVIHSCQTKKETNIETKKVKKNANK